MDTVVIRSHCREQLEYRARNCRLNAAVQTRMRFKCQRTEISVCVIAGIAHKRSDRAVAAEHADRTYDSVRFHIRVYLVMQPRIEGKHYGLTYEVTVVRTNGCRIGSAQLLLE